MSARETFLAHARSILWRAWSTSSEELASEAVSTLMGLGMLVPEGGAVELERLRMLTEASPADLSEDQLGALINAGNRALGDFYHERACACSAWPATCVTNPHYANGAWDTDAFAIGAAALVGVWEALRSDAVMAEVVQLRARAAELEAESVGHGEAIAAAIEQRGRAFLPDHPVWPYIPVFAGIARGRDVLPQRQASPPPDPRRVESAEKVAALVAGQRAAGAVRDCGCPARHERHADGCPTLPADGPEHHAYTTARLREGQ